MSRKNSQTRSKKDTWKRELTARICEVRASTFGSRGRAKFARALGVSPSTYNYYEQGRIPPMPVLLKMSEVSGVDLRWLLTGRFPAGDTGGVISPEQAKILSRMSTLLPRREEAAAALNALLDLLESPPVRSGLSAAGTERGSTASLRAPPATAIPVLGRTAAGVPQFWKQPPPDVALLHAAIAPGTAFAQTRPATLAGPEEAAHVEVEERVHLVQLTEPVRVGELQIAEFIDSSTLRRKWPDAFALRIDGDSMHPSLAHGDLVILSPREAAKPGRPAVVQLRNQIGVTCKLFYADKEWVRLIPINEQFHPTKHPAQDLVWALPVLYRVRLLRPGDTHG